MPNSKIKHCNFAYALRSLIDYIFDSHCKEIFEFNNEKKHSRLKHLFELFSSNNNFNYDFLSSSINGNINGKKIDSIKKIIGLEFTSDFKDKAYSKLELILIFRNQLAHGEVSFVDLGKNKTIADLEDLETVLNYINDFISGIEGYINNKKYLK